MKRSGVVVAVGLALMLAPAVRASAQNLFEVQVFPDENLGRGESEIELHNVVMPGGTPIGDNMIDPRGHVHLSVELTHGWTDTFETGFLLETAPTGGDRHATLTGWHVRPKFRLPASPRIPFHVSLSFEYAVLKLPGDAAFRQALAITPIFEHHNRLVDVSVNPGFELPIKGPAGSGAPVFEPSAKATSRVSGALWLGVEYDAETGSIKNFEPLSEQHHLVFPVVDLRSSSGWDLNVGVGRGLTGGSEHWVAKSIIGFTFRR